MRPKQKVSLTSEEGLKRETDLEAEWLGGAEDSGYVPCPPGHLGSLRAVKLGGMEKSVQGRKCTLRGKHVLGVY